MTTWRTSWPPGCVRELADERCRTIYDFDNDLDLEFFQAFEAFLLLLPEVRFYLRASPPHLVDNRVRVADYLDGVAPGKWAVGLQAKG